MKINVVVIVLFSSLLSPEEFNNVSGCETRQLPVLFNVCGLGSHQHRNNIY